MKAGRLRATSLTGGVFRIFRLRCLGALQGPAVVRAAMYKEKGRTSAVEYVLPFGCMCRFRAGGDYSHSMVEGGFEEMS